MAFFWELLQFATIRMTIIPNFKNLTQVKNQSFYFYKLISHQFSNVLFSFCLWLVRGWIRAILGVIRFFVIDFVIKFFIRFFIRLFLTTLRYLISFIIFVCCHVFLLCKAYFYTVLFALFVTIFLWEDDRNYNWLLFYNYLANKINNFYEFHVNEQKDISIFYMNHVKNIDRFYDATLLGFG